MSSVLNVDTIADKAGTGPVALTKQEASRAYNVFEPDVAATIASLNISGITDNGTGDFTHTFVSAFGAAKQYTFAGSTGNSEVSTSAIEYCKPREEAVILASSVRTSTGFVTATNGFFVDYPNSSFACHGDLA